MRFVVAGGGIAAMAAVERLLQLAEEEAERGGGAGVDLSSLSVSVLSPSPVLHFASHVQRRSAARLTFDVEAAPSSALLERLSRQYGGRVSVAFHEGRLCALHPERSTVDWAAASSGGENSGRINSLSYDRLLLAVGARPSTPWSGERVCVVRDAASIQRLQSRLQRLAKEGEAGGGEAEGAGAVVLVVGNGGIALEVIQLLAFSPSAARLPRVVWALKDDWLGNTLLDPTSSAFLLPLLFPTEDPAMESRSYGEEEGRRMKTGAVERERRARREEEGGGEEKSPPPPYGAALGPHWQGSLGWGRAHKDSTPSSAVPPLLHFNAVVSRCEPEADRPSASAPSVVPDSDGGRPPRLRVCLSNGCEYWCALLISCTGVVPNTDCLRSCAIALDPLDGGVRVGPSLRTSLPRVYAAGDCASLSVPSSPHFLQMRLWSQAIVAGTNAATAMWEDAATAAADAGDGGWGEEADEEEDGRFYYGPFFHETQVLGERLLLFGLFNERRLAWKKEERRQWRAAKRAQRRGSAGDDGRLREQPRHPPDAAAGSAAAEDEDEELGEECRVLMRVSPHPAASSESAAAAGERGHYVKAVMQGGRVVGCTLIGDTGLEEVMENLIANQLDISALGDDWLHADVDLQDFFD